MACKHDKTELVLLLFGELDAPRQEILERQTRECAECDRELAEMRKGAGILNALPKGSASEASLAAIEGEIPRLAQVGVAARLARRKSPAWLAPLAIAATLAAGAVTAVVLETYDPGGARVQSAPSGAEPKAARELRSSPGPRGGMEWRGGLDESLAFVAREIAALRESLLGQDQRACAPTAACGEALDQRLEVLENNIAWLATSPEWTRRAEL